MAADEAMARVINAEAGIPPEITDLGFALDDLRSAVLDAVTRAQETLRPTPLIDAVTRTEADKSVVREHRWKGDVIRIVLKALNESGEIELIDDASGRAWQRKGYGTVVLGPQIVAKAT